MRLSPDLPARYTEYSQKNQYPMHAESPCTPRHIRNMTTTSRSFTTRSCQSPVNMLASDSDPLQDRTCIKPPFIWTRPIVSSTINTTNNQTQGKHHRKKNLKMHCTWLPFSLLLATSALASPVNPIPIPTPTPTPPSVSIPSPTVNPQLGGNPSSLPAPRPRPTFGAVPSGWPQFPWGGFGPGDKPTEGMFSLA